MSDIFLILFVLSWVIFNCLNNTQLYNHTHETVKKAKKEGKKQTEEKYKTL